MKKIKIKKILLFTTIIIIVVVIIYSLNFTPKKITYGVSFSPLQAERLELDWHKTYLAILDDLKVGYVRLSAYWNKIESEKEVLNWSDLDWQMEEAEKRGTKVILVIGRRVPRWPECHDPSWLGSLSKTEQDELNLKIIEEEINHYKNYSNIIAWQVENERLFSLFGTCSKASRSFLKQEIQLVKSLDSRPTITTDSGELSFWLRTSGLADYLGTTVYLKVWNSWIGYWRHLFPPFWYYARGQMAKYIFGNQRVIVSELQAEPWEGGKPLKDTPIETQKKDFSLKDFKSNLSLAKKAGFDEIYFWGAEWWYWLKEKGDNSFWQEAKNIINNN